MIERYNISGIVLMTTPGKVFRIAIIALAVALAFLAPAADDPPLPRQASTGG